MTDGTSLPRLSQWGGPGQAASPLVTSQLYQQTHLNQPTLRVQVPVTVRRFFAGEKGQRKPTVLAVIDWDRMVQQEVEQLLTLAPWLIPLRKANPPTEVRFTLDHEEIDSYSDWAATVLLPRSRWLFTVAADLTIVTMVLLELARKKYSEPDYDRIVAALRGQR